MQAVVIGAGPAGLMAAEVLAGAGAQVDVFDAMPSVGRKFLLAGKGSLNLTHAEPEDLVRTRYREAESWLTPALTAFGPAALRIWAEGLGISTFVGTSGRVFPQEMKAAPMLRAWLQRLGVELDPARLGITDAAQRVQAALGSVRGRNFVGALGQGGA